MTAISQNSTRSSDYFFWSGLALVAVFTSLEPAGTSGAELPVRFIAWMLTIGTMVPLFIAAQMLLQRISKFDQINPWVKVFVSGLVGSLVFVPFGMLIDYALGLDDWSQGLGASFMSLAAEEATGVVPPATLTWVALNAPRILGLSFVKEGGQTPPDRTVSPFLLAAGLSAPQSVWSLSSELHYVRVATMSGKRLVLFNLKDAMAELQAEVSGMQVHRSHWVALSAVEKMDRKAGATYLVLKNGDRVPVGRRRVSEVKAWLKSGVIHPAT